MINNDFLGYNNEEEDPVVTIGFSYVDEYGNEFEQKSKVMVLESCGDTILEEMGDQLNSFLSQIGYIRTNNYMYMNDLTERELHLVERYVKKLRGEGTNKGDTL